MTNLIYLEDTYLFTSPAYFLELRENEKGKAIILDQTIFYPQGGGQPADKGEIRSENASFLVNDVRLDEEGIVWHFGEFKEGNFQAGEEVNLIIDQNKRILNAKLHSAGHLLDCAVQKIQIPNIHAIKGYHFEDAPYVEFDGIIENPEALLPTLQQTIDTLITNNLPIETATLTPEQALSQHVYAPAGKPARVVTFSGFPQCGCGGTHVRSTVELGKISIKKIKSKDGKTKISYSVE